MRRRPAVPRSHGGGPIPLARYFDLLVLALILRSLTRLLACLNGFAFPTGATEQEVLLLFLLAVPAGSLRPFTQLLLKLRFSTCPPYTAKPSITEAARHHHQDTDAAGQRAADLSAE